jgi:hypothetical protein
MHGIEEIREILLGRTEEKHKHRWENNIETDTKEVEIRMSVSGYLRKWRPEQHLH